MPIDTQLQFKRAAWGNTAEERKEGMDGIPDGIDQDVQLLRESLEVLKTIDCRTKPEPCGGGCNVCAQINTLQERLGRR